MRVLPLPTFDDTNSSIVVEMLAALLYGGKCVGYEKITIGAAVKTLTVPAGARIAIISVDGNAGAANANKILHFREDGTAPTAAEGMILGDNFTYEVKGDSNLANFQIVSRDGLNHVIRVQYYGAG